MVKLNIPLAPQVKKKKKRKSKKKKELDAFGFPEF